MIKILKEFKYTSRFKSSIKLSLKLFEKNTEKPMDLYFLLKDGWSITHRSHKYKYNQEHTVIKELLGYYSSEKSTLAATALFHYASSLLNFEFRSTETKGDKVTFHIFSLVDSDEVYEIRYLAMKALSILFRSHKYKMYAIKGLLNYPKYARVEMSSNIIERDLENFVEHFVLIINIDSFINCRILDNLYDACKRNEIEYPNQLPNFMKNQSYKTYKIMKKNYIFENEDLNEAKEIRKSEIESLINDTTFDEIISFWKDLRNDEEKGYENDRWRISKGIDIFFSLLERKNSVKFLKYCGSYIDEQTPYWNYNKGIINGLIEVLGYYGAVDFISSFDFNEKENWLAITCDNITVKAINESNYDDIMDHFTSTIDKSNIMLSPQTIIKVNSTHNEFLIDFLRRLNVISLNRPSIAFNFLHKVFWGSDLDTKSFVDYFHDNIEVLCPAYISAIKEKSNFDIRGKMLHNILQYNVNFLADFLKEVLKINQWSNSLFKCTVG